MARMDKKQINRTNRTWKGINPITYTDALQLIKDQNYTSEFERIGCPLAVTARSYAETNSALDIMFEGTLTSVFDTSQIFLRSLFVNIVFLSHLEARTAGIKPFTSSPASDDIPHTSLPDITADKATMDLWRGEGTALAGNAVTV